MKIPVERVEWPLKDTLAWFDGRTSYDIIKNQDHKFKAQLKDHVIKVVYRINKSFQEKIDVWRFFKPQENALGPLIKGVTRLALSRTDDFQLSITDRYQLLAFINYTFNSIEVDFVHKQVKRYLPLSIWMNLSEARRDIEISKLSPRIRMAWLKLQEQDKKLSPELLEERIFERRFMFDYAQQFLRILLGAVIDPSEDASDEEEEEEVKEDSVRTRLNNEFALYCQRFIEFMIDIESQLPLRRFFHALLDHIHFIEKCQLSDLARHNSAPGHLFAQLVELLLLYNRYDIDIMSGDPLSDSEVSKKHEANIISLQRVLWSKYPHLRKFATKSIRSIDNPNALYQIITSFNSREELYKFMKDIELLDDESLDEDDRNDVPLLASILINRCRKYDSQLKKINSIPLFPNESVIWDTNLVPDEYYNYDTPLALPKLNLQFLTMSDYLLRNFMLFKNESTYEIRKDIEEGIIRSNCKWNSNGTFATGPKQRMALIIKDYSITEVGKPKLGENCPSKVRAKIVINMDYVKPDWRREWEQLRKHDTCFLVSFRKPDEQDEFGWPEGTFPDRNRIKYVRGCEIECLLDSEGKVVDENLEVPKFTNNLRTFLVWMDCNQYKLDMDSHKDRKMTIYDKFHLFIRRKPEQNNFKGVLDTIRNLMDTKFVVPEWLRNLLIGFGDPTEAHHSHLRGSEVATLDLVDTFLDFDHLIENFRLARPNYVVKTDQQDELVDQSTIQPPFKIRIDDVEKQITVFPYTVPSKGPYFTSSSKKNIVRFTPAQTEAIISGLQPGLTMVIGPPGTGKTDVAVQILSALYHTYPNQRTLIVTHSNHALNQIFDKMVELDVEEHHLLRMGHGEEDLLSNKDFSRQGRVKHVLAKRLDLLIQVSKLSQSLDLDPGAGFTCQSAEYFDFFHIVPRWNAYIKSLEGSQELDVISDKFPFLNFFKDAPQPVFNKKTFDEDYEIAMGCYRYIRNIFEQLKAFRPFEIFTSPSDRSQYLLIREAKVIAMTCTYAGLRRKELVDMNFQFDNILMEETAQILEIETTIPLLLQNPENGINRLKRWIMIGDHNQLPPIIQNSAFQKFSNMEQSLFARFIRLGVPAIELDAQGRARSSLCDLYRWRYDNLKDLPHINADLEFRRANSGFVFDYQMINIEGAGEFSPKSDPYFYQNMEEANFLVGLFKYMLKLGYPAQKITILSTYNGQKQLIRDLVEQEIRNDPKLERPSKISTVDKFQGQQNDYVLLSLVRTKHIGHIRDVRRLVVAMSRARYGLYIVARVGLFRECFELHNSMRFLLSRPVKLHLLKNHESYPTTRSIGQPIEPGDIRIVESSDDI